MDKYVGYLFLNPHDPGKFKFDFLEFSYMPFYGGRGKYGRQDWYLSFILGDRDPSTKAQAIIKEIVAAGKSPLVQFYILDSHKDASLLEQNFLNVIPKSNMANIYDAYNVRQCPNCNHYDYTRLFPILGKLKGVSNRKMYVYDAFPIGKCKASIRNEVRDIRNMSEEIEKRKNKKNK